MDTEDIYSNSHYDEFDESDPYARPGADRYGDDYADDPYADDPYADQATAVDPYAAEPHTAPPARLPEGNVPVSKRAKGQISSAVFNVLNKPSLIDDDLTKYMPRPPPGSASLDSHVGEGQVSTVDTIMPVAEPQRIEVHKEGYLTKLGAKFKTWKKRWFVLDKKELKYYKSNGGGLIGTIQLTSSCEVTLNLDKKHCIVLVCPDRTWHFIAANDDDMNAWRGMIQEGLWLK